MGTVLVTGAAGFLGKHLVRALADSGEKVVATYRGRAFRTPQIFADLMGSKVEAARALARRVAVFNAAGAPQVQYSIATKVFCTNASFEVASDALQIFGGNGLSREYPIEKLLRDARASLIEDGCNEVLSIVGASRL